MEIHVNGKSYIIEPLEQETDKVLASRIWFIIKQNPENEVDFLEAERLSIIWYYSYYYKCRYPSVIQNKVDRISGILYD